MIPANASKEKSPWVVTLGDLVMDMTASAPPRGMRHATDALGGIRANPGGSAANFAAWTARLGIPVRFAVRVGTDVLGEALVTDLRRDSVEVLAVQDPERPTGVILIFLDSSGEHSMLVSPGANHNLQAADLPEDFARGARLLHLSGYALFWKGPRAAAQRAQALARESGLWISLDPNSVELIRQRGVETFWRSAAGADILLPNLDEGRLLTGEADPQRVIEVLAGRVPLAVLKLGAEGALLASGSLRLHVPAEPTAAVDTTGAGDAWAAAFLSSLLADAWQGPGLPPEPTEDQLGRAARRANHLAAWVVARHGARPRGDFPRN